MVDFIILNYFPYINASDSNRVLALYQEVVEKTAHMIALWQSVGFTHGVCNTDNFSILGLTIDYGPFGFMDDYDPTFVPNTSDDEGLYRFERQPDVGWFNLNKLRIALLPLLSIEQQKTVDQILDGYVGIYKSKYMNLLMKKLGFTNKQSHTSKDEQLVAVLFKIMQDTRADFTMTFRELSEIKFDDLKELINNVSTFPKFWTLPVLANHDWFPEWVEMYEEMLAEAKISDETRQKVMLSSNPRYVLRNWIAQFVIERVEKDSFDEIQTVLSILENPFTLNDEAERLGFARSPPAWSRKLKVSCSS